MSVLDSTEVLDVAGYAAAVRRSLVDLGPDQVDDLTDDLEADLADALADERHNAHGRGVLEQFGPPEEYAAELRAAAGLLPVAAAGAARVARAGRAHRRRAWSGCSGTCARSAGGRRSRGSSSRSGRSGGWSVRGWATRW